MRVSLYNTLSRKKEMFKPLHNAWVGLYTCGPTVYNFAHIGNLRTFIFEDVLRRMLEYAGHKVKHIRNITDVDDKTIRASHAAGKSLKDFTREYELFFKDDLRKLNILFPAHFPRATEHIREMVHLIQKLLKKGFAYRADGSIYFDISKFKTYGKLSRVKNRQLKAGARVDVDEYTKEHVEDFVLWKGKKKGEPSWKAPFGEGRPGWHIECSAMAMKYLGKMFDMHTAGIDLLFPHHENEIAQSEAATGRPFVRYWLYGEHLLVNGEKMAKSLGNFFTLRDIESRGFNPLAFRYLILTSHYRSKLNFTWKSLEAARNSLERLYEFISRLSLHRSFYKGLTSIGRYEQHFRKAIFDDLDTPKALAILWKMIHTYNKTPERFSGAAVRKLFYDFDRVLGLGLRKLKKASIPEKVRELVLNRERARKEKRWQEADAVRENVRKLGFIIEDTDTGPRVTKK